MVNITSHGRPSGRKALCADVYYVQVCGISTVVIGLVIAVITLPGGYDQGFQTLVGQPWHLKLALPLVGQPIRV